MSAHYAALDMFANIFPRGTTWLQVTEFIATQKKPLQELQRMKDAVQIWSKSNEYSDAKLHYVKTDWKSKMSRPQFAL